MTVVPDTVFDHPWEPAERTFAETRTRKVIGSPEAACRISVSREARRTFLASAIAMMGSTTPAATSGLVRCIPATPYLYRATQRPLAQLETALHGSLFDRSVVAFRARGASSGEIPP